MRFPLQFRDERREMLVEQWRQRSERLFDIENGNCCALCQKPLSWMCDAPEDSTPISLDIRHAICKPCFEMLKQKWEVLGQK